ncbi:MAG TPA: HPF/RaiA family ribosome-associated protein [Candidatus Krumholzibacteria bacterium]|nr:HPF/RaiA family ribosome-associated protein [Candidatus Krumholzibacteria bacterium]HPD71290.1 HPF/RaiA family ribosome-associated protein [Candidatus Krumholzibacteria bacterium]HRY39010.1 HPF/RaiA family ribosome-associated protein [Candidatus Krumholzibacteria bacterium]
MNLEIKTRHFQLGDETRAKIEAQFEKILRFSPRPVNEIRLQIVLEKNDFICDGLLLMRNQEFRAANTGAEPDLATQGVAENLQRQLEKYKGKVSAKQRAEEGGLGRAMRGGEPLVHFATENFSLLELDALAAREAFTDSDAPFLVFRNVDSGRISVVYRRRDGELGLMEATNG